MRTAEQWGRELRTRLWNQHSMPLTVAEAIEAEAAKLVTQAVTEALAEERKKGAGEECAT